MSVLSMVEANLPPGFRFHPTDDELICDYLRRRASAATDEARFHGFPAMVDVDLNKCEPWDLPETACVRGKEWYFFSVKDKKYATGQRTNRATLSGYWKATGKDRHVSRKGALVGMRKTLVFYLGRAPKGKKTEWVMHDFRMETSSSSNFSFKDQDWVLCKVFNKGRPLCRKISTTEVSGESGDGDGDRCSSLPPLMEPQIASLNQAPLNIEQVPCFSRFSTNQATPNHFSSSSLNTISCDEKALEVVLSQLTKVDEENQHINESCFFESAIASLWNPFASF